MGSGNWDAGTYTAATEARKATGTPAFAYTDYSAHRPRDTWKAHEDLDPAKLNAAGKNVREALDSDEHPNATPIAVLFDVTGSMGRIPQVLQQKLPQLHGLLQRKGYVEDPQILFGGIGDASCDRVPLQVGQFESDNRMDETLDNILLEGGGGGGNHESYQLAMYYMATHTDLDSVTKRGKRGYLFIIGDERVYDKVDRRQVEKVIGDKLPENISTSEIVRQLQEKFEVFFLFAAQGSYEPADVLDPALPGGRYGDSRSGVCYWRDLLGQNALMLEEADAVCETIAMTLGLMEGVIDHDAGLADLRDVGADLTAVRAAGKALAQLGGNSSVATATGNLPERPADDQSETTRL